MATSTSASFGMRWVDEAWHAGTSETWHVTDALSDITTCRAVFGNIDDQTGASNLAGTCALSDWWTAGLDDPHWRATSRSTPKAFCLSLKEVHRPISLFADTATFCSCKGDAWGGLHLNPGAAGISGFHKVCTMLKFKFTKARLATCV